MAIFFTFILKFIIVHIFFGCLSANISPLVPSLPFIVTKTHTPNQKKKKNQKKSTWSHNLKPSANGHLPRGFRGIIMLRSFAEFFSTFFTSSQNFICVFDAKLRFFGIPQKNFAILLDNNFVEKNFAKFFSTKLLSSKLPPQYNLFLPPFGWQHK